MKLLKLVTINLAVFLGISLCVFAVGEAYFTIKHIFQQEEREKGFWGATHPRFAGGIFKLVPGQYALKHPKHVERFEINEQGFRKQNFDPEKNVDVVIYGDSFSFGDGVSQGQRYSDILSGNHENLNIANLAYNGGFTSAHYVFDFNIRKFAPGRILVLSYLGNDCQSDMWESTLLAPTKGGYPRRTISKDNHLAADLRSESLIIQVLAKTHFFRKVLRTVYNSHYGALVFGPTARPNQLNEKSFDRGEDSSACMRNLEYLKALENICKQRNPECTLTNFWIPQNWFVDPLETVKTPHTALTKNELAATVRAAALFDVLRANCAEQGVNCINLTNTLRQAGSNVYIANDAHWNPKGHATVAKLISTFLRDDELPGD